MTGKEYIYLDNAATTALDPRVLEAMLPFLKDKFGNPSSIHGKGRETKAPLEQAREHVAGLFNAAPAEIIFTSGGTEANNLALYIALQNTVEGKQRLISSAAEHESILKPLSWYRATGHDVTLLDVAPDASVPLESAAAAIQSGAALVALMHVNNETGGFNDIAGIASLAHERDVFFHTDAVQSAGKYPLDSQAVPFDSASASAHKIHGPKGIGALYIRAGHPVVPYIRGGAQERGRRGGTENAAAIIGFGEAARIALLERDARIQLWKLLHSGFRQRCKLLFPEAIVNTSAEVTGSIVSLSFPYNKFHLDGEALLMNMDLEGVALSTGSACTAGSIEPSHVMLAAGHDIETSKSTLRFSFGKDTSESDVHRALDILQSVVQRMQFH